MLLPLVGLKTLPRLLRLLKKEIGMLKIENRGLGWRARKGPQEGNGSGFRASGHRLLLSTNKVEEKSAGGIIFVAKTVEKEKNIAVKCTVVEIGFDAWSDKSTDLCDIGDEILVGQYTGKFQVSEKDGLEYRFVSDLDVISTIEK